MRAFPNTPGDLRSADGSYSGFHRGIFIHIVPTGRHELSSFDILALTPSSDLGWNELPGRGLPAAPIQIGYCQRGSRRHTLSPSQLLSELGGTYTLV